jgi:hypothetical protein
VALFILASLIFWFFFSNGFFFLIIWRVFWGEKWKYVKFDMRWKYVGIHRHFLKFTRIIAKWVIVWRIKVYFFFNVPLVMLENKESLQHIKNISLISFRISFLIFLHDFLNIFHFNISWLCVMISVMCFSLLAYISIL